MKKTLLFLAISSICLASCTNQNKDEERQRDQQKIDSLSAIIANKDKELDDFMQLVAQVDEGFRLMKEAEGRIDVIDASKEGGNKERIAENMQFIQNQMQQNRLLIDQLKKKLNSSTSNLSSLNKQIQKLEKEMEAQKGRVQELLAQLAERDQIIATQGAEITQLNQNVNSLVSENEKKTAEVAAQDKELNKAWFVFGTKSELKEQKILEHGDVLQSNRFNKGYFTQIDIRYTKDIRLFSKSAKLLTNHPANSYQITKDSDGLCELHITNPTQFWSVSKYLVVQVK